MSPADKLQCHIVATRDADSPLWTFFLVNDGGETIESAELNAVRYEWGDQYVGGESPGTTPGARAVIWQNDGSSEMRTNLWLRVTHQGLDGSLRYRQEGVSAALGNSPAFWV